MSLLQHPENEFRIDRLKPYLLGSIAQAVLEARLAGKDVIDLSQANPDNPPPRPIIDRLVQATLLPQNHRYSSSQGIRRLRDGIAGYYKSCYATNLDADSEVVSVMGTKEGMSHLLQAVVNPGDTIIVPTPAYPIHAAAVFLAGASYVGVPLVAPSAGPNSGPNFIEQSDQADIFLENIAEAYKRTFPRPRLMILSFPHNPTTITVELSFFERVVNFARENNIYLIHDFAYSSICFDDYKAPSILQVPGAKDHAVEFFSMSKGFGLAGWRVGFAVGNSRLIGALKKIKSYIDFGIFQPLQIAAAELLESPDDYLAKTKQTFQKRRDTLVSGLRNLGWTVDSPKATVFVWAKIPSNWKSQGSVQVCHELLEKYDVAACPGLGFDEDADSYVRFCLVENEERIESAIKRMSGTEATTA
jgi:alanine-synthesizing transaminase